jgi:small subunit ribosomal protein S17
MSNNRRRLIGRVASAKMNKTLVVTVEVSKRHPVYDKVVRETRKFYAHDENNTAQEGDIVQIVESQPLSKLKRWALERIVETKLQVATPVGVAEGESQPEDAQDAPGAE